MTLQQALEHHQRGELGEAEAIYNRILAENPDEPDALHLLGVIASSRGELEKAIDFFDRAIRLRPTAAEYHINLGNALRASGEIELALAHHELATQLAPDEPKWHDNLGSGLRALGRIDEAVISYRKAIALDPQFKAAHHNLLLTLNYDDRLDPRDALRAHREWAQQFADPLPRDTEADDKKDADPDRKLKLAFLSADLRTHSVAFFLEHLLAHHDREQFEIHCYSDVTDPDTTTARLKLGADGWRDIAGLSDEAVADRIRSDCIDIVIELAGHTHQNRLLALARRPAPVQVSYLGYPNTTGMPAIDYRITDGVADPPGSEGQYVEQVVRLPRTAWCYRPPDDAPAVNDRPASAPVTFGSFNYFAKISPTMIELWTEILRRTADLGSRLFIKAFPLRDPAVQESLIAKFGTLGLEGARDRLILSGQQRDPIDHLRHYELVDVALDAFPYAGTTTTCEALWMGVPVVTLGGVAPASRVGVSLLTGIGLPELAAHTTEQYIQAAVDLARDRERMAKLRTGMRQRMSASPLMDGPGFARDFQGAMRDVWCRLCAGRPRA